MDCLVETFVDNFVVNAAQQFFLSPAIMHFWFIECYPIFWFDSIFFCVSITTFSHLGLQVSLNCFPNSTPHSHRLVFRCDLIWFTGSILIRCIHMTSAINRDLTQTNNNRNNTTPMYATKICPNINIRRQQTGIYI